VTGIDSEDASVLDMTANPYSPAASTFSDLLTERSHVVASGSLHSGRSVCGDRSRWANSEESMPLAMGIDTSAAVTVPGGLGEVDRSSARHGAQSSQQKSLGASQTRPLGQGGGPARPDERRARPSARPARMVGRVKVEAAHSRPQDRSNVL
jgi:hypothetical protein